MQRDMDLVREILLRADASEEDISLRSLAGEAATPADLKKFDYHIHMLVEQAGLLTGIDAEDFDGPDWIDLKMTWRGHEFLDQIRDPEIWRKAKAGAAKAGGFSLELIGALAKGLVKKQIEKHTGVEIDI